MSATAVSSSHAGLGWRALLFFLAVAAGNALLILSAKIQVPFWPVPMTLQTLAVMVLPVFLFWKPEDGLFRWAGVAAVMAYLAEGAAGFPVFAGTPVKGIGLAYMAGPTGGYLLGFLLAAAFVSWQMPRSGGQWLRCFGIMLAATVLVYIPGYAWLSVLIGPEKAYIFGVQPFLPAAGLKLALAVALAAGPLPHWCRRKITGAVRP